MKNRFSVDFIGIGAEKAATYWVAAILREHPEVCFSKRKEIAFFNEFDQHFLKIRNPRYDWGIKWYKKHFIRCQKGKIKGEYTPTYLYSKKAAKRIKKHFPQVKLIVCLRDPVKRAFSQYLHDKSIGIIKKFSFEEAIKTHSSYVEKGKYHKHLRAYYELFSEKNILVVFVEDIKKDPRKVATQIYKFLGVTSDYKPVSLKKKFNVASDSRFWLINYFLLQTEYFIKKNRFDWVYKILEDTGIRNLFFLISYYPNRKSVAKYPTMRKNTESRLRKMFLEDINELEKG